MIELKLKYLFIKVVKLKAFEQFGNNAEALKAAVGVADSKLTKGRI